MDAAGLSYRELAPPAALAPWLACTWERADGGGQVRVLPDGCVDVVWRAGATVVAGPDTGPVLVDLQPGELVVGARMRPGAAAAMLGVRAEALRDARPELRDVWGEPGARLAAELDAAADPRAALVEALLARRDRLAPPDPLVGAAVRALADPGARVGRVAAALAVSERQLRRRFEAAVGYGPKLLARVLRLQRALAAARAGDELARAALEAGYADQAHLAHDCRDLAGVPPTALVR